MWHGGHRGPTERCEKKYDRGWEITLVIARGTRAKAAASGCAESTAALTGRKEAVTPAPILKSLSRSALAVAWARCVPTRAGLRRSKRLDAKAEDPELVGDEACRRGPVGEEIQLLLLDRVLHVALRTVDARVDDAGREGVDGQRGDDRAGVGLARQVFRLGHEAAPVRAPRQHGVKELGEPACRAAVPDGFGLDVGQFPADLRGHRWNQHGPGSSARATPDRAGRMTRPSASIWPAAGSE